MGMCKYGQLVRPKIRPFRLDHDPVCYPKKVQTPPPPKKINNFKISTVTTKLLSPKMSSDGFSYPENRSLQITITNITEYPCPFPGNIPGGRGAMGVSAPPRGPQRSASSVNEG